MKSPTLPAWLTGLITTVLSSLPMLQRRSPADRDTVKDDDLERLDTRKRDKRKRKYDRKRGRIDWRKEKRRLRKDRRGTDAK